MRKRAKIVFAGVLAAAIGLAAWEALRGHARAPIYYGKPLSHWVRHTEDDTWMAPSSSEGIIKVDARAVPFLIKYLEARDSRLHRFYFAAWPKLPLFLRKRLSEPANIDAERAHAVSILGRLGAEAKPAIPALIRVLRADKDFSTRVLAAFALQCFAREDQTVQAALIEAMEDKQTDVREVAAEVLFKGGAASPEIQAALHKRLSDPDYHVRDAAARYLRQRFPAALDPKASAGTGEKTNELAKP